MSEGEPVDQMAHRLLGGITVERHQGGATSSAVDQIRAPAVRIDEHCLDEVSASVDCALEAMNCHGFRGKTARKKR
jgi:hypothetical protein